jgi:hypothetical protein
MEGKILAKFLTALIFGSFDQAKEHKLNTREISSYESYITIIGCTHKFDIEPYFLMPHMHL